MTMDTQTLTATFVAGLLFGAAMLAIYAARRRQALEEVHDRAMDGARDQTRLALEELRTSAEWKSAMELAYKQGKEDAARETLSHYKGSDEFSALLSIEHAKGKDAGARQEKERLSIAVTPFTQSRETFFSTEEDIGYELQISYDGFPIGPPGRHIGIQNVKSKDENVLKAIGFAQDLVNAIGNARGLGQISMKPPKRTPAPRKK